MPGPVRNEAEELPPHVQLIEMATASWGLVVVHAAARFGLADHIGDGAKTAEELAAPTGTHARSLYRLMRTLASLGILEEDADRRFRTTPVGAALKTGAPGSARATILTFGSDWFWESLTQFSYSVETGRSAAEKAMGMPVFEFLGRHPEKAALFTETMAGFHGREPAAVAAAYDFSGFGTIVDVGGASGNMLTTILGKFAGPKGILFDLPHVEPHARAHIEASGLADRIQTRPGSFFESVPEGGDAYILSHVIHDWSEGQCITILENVRKAMNPGGKLLLVEMVLPTGNTPHPGKILDMIMLALPGGEERSEEEYRTLFQKAGFRLQRVVPTESAVSVVEAVAG